MFWITSDTHFGHQLMTKYRPWDTVEEHDAALIANWNRVVGEDDTVLHQGDVVMGLRRENLPVMERLNGRHVLIPGNHDNCSSTFKPRQREGGMKLYGEYFTILPEIVEIPVNDEMQAVFSHYPPAEIPDHGDEDRYPDQRPLDNGTAWFFHGHTHDEQAKQYLKTGSVALQVGVDANDFAPVDLYELMRSVSIYPHEATRVLEHLQEAIG